MPENHEREHWHLEKRVPITIIIAVVVQTIVIGIWIGRFETRMDTVEAVQVESKISGAGINHRQWDRIVELDAKGNGLSNLIAGMAASMESVERDIGRIFAILDKKKRNE